MPLLETQYFLEDKGGKWERCTVMNMSRIGVGVKYHTPEKINIGSIVHLKTFVSTEMEPFSVKGVLRWFEPLKGGKSVGGIELAEELDRDRFTGLCLIYAGDYRAE